MDQQLLEEINRVVRDALSSPLVSGQGENEAEQPLYSVPPPIINVYVINAPPEEEACEEPDEPAIESSLASEPESEPAADPIMGSFPLHKRSFWHRYRWGLAGLCLFALIAGLGTAYFSPFLFPTAEVIILPMSQSLTTTSTITVITSGAVHPGTQEMAGRALSSLLVSQQRSIPTTGSGQHAAQAGHGFVTFYNALQAPQSIPAGTLLTGADGVQIVTEQSVSIPAGTGVTNGYVSVPAHALQSGPVGNIAAGDLNGTCCRSYVLVKNTAAFTGGQEARSYQAVRQQDLDATISALKIALAQSVQAAFEVQVHPEETLLTPVPCTTQEKSDHQVGEEASQVTVTVSETCQGTVYQTQAMQILLDKAQQAQAATHLGAGYILVGVVHPTITISSMQQGQVMLHVQAGGTWVYQFTEAELSQCAGLIAGRTKQEATVLLLHEPGVRQVMISTSNGDALMLPTAVERIQVGVLSTPQGA